MNDPKAIMSAEELAASDVIELRATHNGRTVSMACRVVAASGREPSKDRPLGGYYLELGLLGAAFSDLTDVRMDRQRSTINRLLAHVSAHCPEFLPQHPGQSVSECEFMREERAKTDGA